MLRKMQTCLKILKRARNRKFPKLCKKIQISFLFKYRHVCIWILIPKINKIGKLILRKIWYRILNQMNNCKPWGLEQMLLRKWVKAIPKTCKTNRNIRMFPKIFLIYTLTIMLIMLVVLIMPKVLKITLFLKIVIIIFKSQVLGLWFQKKVRKMKNKKKLFRFIKMIKILEKIAV